MLKLKYIVLSVMIQISVFILLFLMISLIGVKFGEISSDKYILGLEVSSFASVLIAGFTGAKIAWDKGAWYGLCMATIWVVIRLAISLSFSNEIDIQSLVIKSLIILASGFISGALGVAKDKNNFI